MNESFVFHVGLGVAEQCGDVEGGVLGLKLLRLSIEDFDAPYSRVFVSMSSSHDDNVFQGLLAGV